MNMNKFRYTGIIKVCFVLLYIGANIWSIYDVYSNNRLNGDFYGYSPPKIFEGWLALSVIVTIYLVPFRIFKPNKINKKCYDKVNFYSDISGFVFILQMIYLFFVIFFSFGKAGGDANKAGGFIRFFFYLINPDALFLIYFFHAYDRKQDAMYSLNMIIYAVSNILRGWIGFVFFIGFIFVNNFLLYVSKKGSFVKILITTPLAALILAFSLLLIYFKLYLRVGAGDIKNILFSLDYFNVFAASLDMLLSRLQILSSVLFQVCHNTEIHSSIKSGIIGNFFTDGLPQQTLIKLLGVSSGENYNLYLYSNFLNSNSEFQTIINSGIAGWLFVLPFFWVPFFLFYLMFLVYVNRVLAKLLDSYGINILSWLAFYVYVIPGWFGTYILFLFTLMLYCFYLKFVRKLLINMHKYAIVHKGNNF